jgi:penicillin-binding protein 1A
VLVAGKTGTTENYGDAWFVGWTKEYTVAVWVGYPDELRPMETEWQGEPVAGGTYPAAIWGAFMKQVQAMIDEARKKKEAKDGKADPEASSTPGGTTPPPTGTVAPGVEGGTTEGADDDAPEQQAAPRQEAQPEPQAEEPAAEEPPAQEEAAPADPGAGGTQPGGGTSPPPQ